MDFAYVSAVDFSLEISDDVITLVVTIPVSQRMDIRLNYFGVV